MQVITSTHQQEYNNSMTVKPNQAIKDTKAQTWHAKTVTNSAWYHLHNLACSRQEGLIGRVPYIAHLVYWSLFAGCVVCAHERQIAASILFGASAGLFVLVELLRAHRFYGLNSIRRELWELCGEYRDLADRNGFMDHRADLMRRSAEAIKKAHVACAELATRGGHTEKFHENVGVCSCNLYDEFVNIQRVIAGVLPRYTNQSTDHGR